MQARKNKRWWKAFWCDRGTSMVEFALTAPFLILLALGIIEIGRYLSYSVVVGNAVRAGAQVGVTGVTPAQALPDPNQPNSSNMDYLASQEACNDAYQDLSVGESGFSCTSKGTTAPTNGLLIKTQFTCFNPSDCFAQPVPPGRTMYITVSATGRFKSLIHYPLLPDNVPISAQTTVQVGL